MARTAEARLPRRPLPLGRRGQLLAVMGLAALLGALYLERSPAGLFSDRWRPGMLAEFAAAALRPALDYEGQELPPGNPPLLLKALAGAWRTVVFAASAMSLALLIGLPLGLVGSASWWAPDPLDGAGGRKGPRRVARRVLVPPLFAGLRLLIALLRSVHELLWAVIFLAAFGLNTASAVIAIAIPYAGTLAKVFSEMLDETPRSSADALRALGASPGQVYLVGILPRAAADMGAYAFYRFECAVRSSAVLGFFGFPTLGYYLSLSFENLHFREVWTYLYTLLALIVILELWSGLLRRRLVVR